MTQNKSNKSLPRNPNQGQDAMNEDQAYEGS